MEHNFKIVTIGEGHTAKQVLLFRDRDEDGEEQVTLHAWHDDKGSEPVDRDAYVQIETYAFPNMGAAQQFIRDFSVMSAQDFIDRFSL